MKKPERNIIVYVSLLPPGAVESIRAYEKKEKRKFRVMLIRDTRDGSHKEKDAYKGLDILVECDFGNPANIAEALAPYQSDCCAITSRSQSHMARFIEVIPHVPASALHN